jgi:type II secretory pathway pseudopilin PulG
MKKTNITNNQRGYSILEVLVAALITAVIAASGFQFYTKMHGQSETQYNVSEMQQLARSSLYDMRKSLLQAGFKLTAHIPYKISGDTLAVYYSVTLPVDTIQYYLVEFDAGEYANIRDRISGTKLYKLVKKVNSGTAAIFADYITDINFKQIDAANIVVSINVQAMHRDDAYKPNGGFRIYTLTERINVRNVG